MRTLVVVACLSAVGCADGTSVLTLSVTSDAVVTGVDHLVVQVTDVAHNRVAKPVTVALPDAPAMIPPARTVALVLPSTVRGVVHLDVTAVDVDGAMLSATARHVRVAEQEPGRDRDAARRCARPGPRWRRHDLHAVPDAVLSGIAAVWRHRMLHAGRAGPTRQHLHRHQLRRRRR